MAASRIPSPEQIERAITIAAQRGINEAMERIEAKAARVAPYDPADDGERHLRDSGVVKRARILPDGDVVGGVRFRALSTSRDNYPYAPVQHLGFYHRSDGQRVPITGYFKYQSAFAKREFLGTTMRTNRFGAKRTVAKHIRAAIAAQNKAKWI